MVNRKLTGLGQNSLHKADTGFEFNYSPEPGVLNVDVSGLSTDPTTIWGSDYTKSIVFTPVVTPLPGALPMFATGLGALGLLGSRRKKKAIAT
jgi:hypothetical protein